MIPDLLASCWTTAGNTEPRMSDTRSPFALDDRIAAAAEAGFTGFGILHADLVEAEDRHSLDWIHQQLDRHGMVHVELEMIYDWYADGDRRVASDHVRDDLFRAAEVLAPRQIKVGAETNGFDWDWSRVVDRFGELCDAASPTGVPLAFEPMPFGQIKTLVDGRRLIDEAGRRNAGLILDRYHMDRSHVSLDEIAALPARYIQAVELDDADVEVHGATLIDDTIDYRRPCGHGELDITGFIRAVLATGYDGPWGVELLSREYRLLPLAEQASVAFTTTIDQFTDITTAC